MSQSTYVALCQQLGAELHIVLEVKGAARFKLVTEAGHGDRLAEFLHAAHAAELPVGVLRDGQPRRPPVSPVVVVRDRGAGGCGLVVVVAELVVGRHIDRLENCNVYGSCALVGGVGAELCVVGMVGRCRGGRICQ